MTPGALSGGGQVAVLVLAGCAALGTAAWAGVRTASDFLTGGSVLTGRRNGFALCGAYLSAASLLGVSGVVALSGYDGVLYCVGAVVAWIPALLLARLVRNTGRVTMADVLCHRAVNRPRVRVASAVSTVTISVCFLVAQLSAAGVLCSYLFGVRRGTAVVAVGALTVLLVAAGGLKGTTWLQIGKTVLLLSACALMTLLTAARFGFDLNGMLGTAADASGSGGGFLDPGLRFGGQTPPPPPESISGKLDLLSLAVALALGAAGLPHVVNRFFTVPSGRAARTSVRWAMGLTGAFFAMILILGFGAAALIGHEELLAGDPDGLFSVPRLVHELGVRIAGPVCGDVLLAFFAVAALATVVAVTASTLLAAVTSVAHDWFGRVLMLGRPKEREQLAVARVATLVVGAGATALSLPNLDVSFLVGLTFAVAASATVPAVVLTLFWRRLTGTGVTAAIYGGLATSLTLTIFSPAVSGKVDPATGESLSLLPAGVDFAWFPLENPALIAVPAALLCAVLGTYLSDERPDPGSFRELTVRSLIGAGRR